MGGHRTCAGHRREIGLNRALSGSAIAKAKTTSLAVGLMAATCLLYPALVLILAFIATDTALLYSAFRAQSLVITSIALAPVIVGEELV